MDGINLPFIHPKRYSLTDEVFEEALTQEKLRDVKYQKCPFVFFNEGPLLSKII